MGMGRNWTTGEVRRLHELWQQGFTAAEIADTFGRTTHAIYNRLRYCAATRSCPASNGSTPDRPPRTTLGYRPRWTSEEINDLIALRQSHVPFKLIAREIGRSAFACQDKFARVAA